MPGRNPDPSSVTGGVPGGSPYGWRRRQLVVDARYQLRSGVLVGAVAIVLLTLLNASLFVHARTPSAMGAMQDLFAGPERSSWILLLVGSAVFLVGVIVIGLLESHRTAGASYAIRRAVDAIRNGDSHIRVRLRRGDHLQDLARSVNELAETIDGERLRRG